MGRFRTTRRTQDGAAATPAGGSADVARPGFAERSAEAASLNARGAEMRRLWAEGLPGRATITAVRDTGERLAGNTVVELELDVELEAGDPYPATLRIPIAGTDVTPYRPGSRYNVRVDPQDRGKLTFSA
ncbi:MAG: hypothetical protein JWM31_3075 [Solirubrobacterales bacterium]|nr:hypothetical protein [Solirubrobacterales bacterium]